MWVPGSYDVACLINDGVQHSMIKHMHLFLFMFK